MKPEQFTLRAEENHGNLQSFLIRVLFTHSLKPPPPSPAPPPPPVLLPPLAHCLGRSTIVYSVASRASADTPKAKAREQWGGALGSGQVSGTLAPFSSGTLSPRGLHRHARGGIRTVILPARCGQDTSTVWTHNVE